MKYDPNKDIVEETTVKLQWHGEDTRVLLHKSDGEKTLVEKGDVVEVTVKKARQLLKYSSKWTKEGDKPTKHAFDTEMEKLAKKSSRNVKNDGDSSDESDDESGEEKTPDEVDALRTKKAVVAEIVKLDGTVNDQATLDEMKSIYRELYDEKHPSDESDDESGE